MNELEIVLSNLLEYHEALLVLGKEKVEVIQNKDIERFEKITLEEQVLVKKIEQAEAERIRILKKLFPSETGNFTLAECIEKTADSEHKENIKELRRRLVLVVEELRHCNDLNRQLVRESLNYVNFTLDLVRPPRASASNYGATGKQGMPSSMMGKKSMFDSQA